jgi:hypothetical protein
MGPAGILLHMRTKRSVLKADRTQIGRNHLASRDYLRGNPLYISVIVSQSSGIKVISTGGGQS